MIDISRYLTQTASVKHKKAAGGTSAWIGDGSEFASAVPYPCFAYFGDVVQVLDPADAGMNAILSAPTRWQILFSADLCDTLKTGDVVVSVTDPDNNVVRESGTVSEVNVYRNLDGLPYLVVAKLAE